MMRRFDVVVVGAGVAGMTTALRLNALGHTAAVLGAANRRRPFPETIRGQTMERLRQFVRPDDLLEVGRASDGSIISWGKSEPKYLDQFLFPLQPAWHVDRRALDDLLRARCRECGVVLLASRLTRIMEPSVGEWSLTVTANGRDVPINCRFVVDATGRSSWLSRKLGAAKITVDSSLTAGAIVPLAQRGFGRLVVESTPNGFWYLCPYTEHNAVVAFVYDWSCRQEGDPTQPEDWRESLLRTALLSRFVAVPESPAIALRSQLSGTERISPAQGERWLAVADAAIACDPLSGAGTSRAVEGALAAGDAIDACLAGDPSLWRQYDAELDLFWNDFLHERSFNYSQEQRWPQSSFWRHRIRQDTSIVNS